MSVRRVGVHASRGVAWLVAVAAWLIVFTSPGDTAYLQRGAPADTRLPPSASITLVTGDRVRLQTRPDGSASTVVMPAAGRETISFITLSSKSAAHGDEITVTPADAVPLVAAGLLDPQLFNVSALVRQGLTGDDDAGPPLILTFEARARAAVAPLAAAGVTATRSLASINGVAVSPAKGAATAFWQWFSGGGGPERTAAVAAGRATSAGRDAGVAKVWLDARAQPLLDQSGPQIGLPRARQLGLTGKGVTIAMLDTGVKLDHPDFDGRIVESRDFTNTRPDANDDVGHGTHTTSIAAGTGLASGGRYQGMAPQALIINGKVCLVFGCPLSSIIAGMEWAAPKARIINMSLGGDPSDGTDPWSMALNALSAQYGTLFVVAAGNFGGPQTIGTPASAHEAFAVGSVTKQDALSPFSSRGPGLRDFAIKPDITAPGSDIVAARAPGTFVGDRDPVDENYTRLSGTSMAAPHVAGAAALVLEAHPDWTAAQVRAALASSALPIDGLTVYDQGAGRLDIARAVTQTVFAGGDLSFGLIRFPQDQPAMARTVTYTNLGDAPATVQLALHVTDAHGASVPSGVFSVDPASLIVPAHGTADAQVTFDPLDRTPGLFGGHLIATSGSDTMVTAVGAFQEVESYDLTLRAIGRAANFFFGGLAVNLDNGAADRISLSNTMNTRTLRLPRGRYEIDGLISSTGLASDPERLTTTLVSEPNVTLDRDTTVVLDAMRDSRISAQVDDIATVPVTAALSLSSEVPAVGQSITVAAAIPDIVVAYAVPTTAVTGRTYAMVYEPTIGVPTATGFSSLYSLAFVPRGRIPDQLAFRVRVRDLALLRTTYHAQGVPIAGFRHSVAFPRGLDVALSLIARNFAVPTQRDEYYMAQPDLEWEHGASFGTGTFLDFEDSARFIYRPGSVRSIGWNRAPLGPAFATPTFFGTGRHADTLSIRVGLFSSNQEGHGNDPGAQPLGVTGQTTLSRNGVDLGSTALPCGGTFPVPAEPAQYTVTCSGTRDLTQSNLGTHAEATFTFTDPGPNAGAQSLPMLVVRATGTVFAFDTAPAGRIFPLGLRVERPANAARAPITALDLEVSYDDGRTWTRVPVLRLPGSDRALTALLHPRTPGFVSLRAHAADSAGNTVTQTMIRAYGLVLVP